jgi:hypothetical protein
LTDKLSRVLLTPVDIIDGNMGLLNIGIGYTARAVETHTDNFHYEITISYSDEENNQLVSDPNNCIDYRLY